MPPMHDIQLCNITSLVPYFCFPRLVQREASRWISETVLKKHGGVGRKKKVMIRQDYFPTYIVGI